jgi:hypothetical protein
MGLDRISEHIRVMLAATVSHIPAVLLMEEKQAFVKEG